ncbi:MAG: hypothetical protein Q8N12_09745 [Thermodesulfovibrionales bacterium]|nr:hypothetical protein [Thermodesulfovibrionales bacterium]
MNFERSQPLHKNIEVKATNRPVKIAYLVPYDESPTTHWILDAVFHESYTRWGGARTLIIPTNNSSFLSEEYDKWLQFYDPDFIYTYVDLEQSLIEKIAHSCCPIAFMSNKESDITRWQDYLPDWGVYFKPISALSTIHSPHVGYHSMPWAEREPKITIVTQYSEVSEERFIADNFGTAFNLHMNPNPIQGLFETLCLVPNDLDERTIAGTRRSTSITDIVAQIANRKAVPIANLAMAHGHAIPRVQPYSWSNNFNLFMGDTCLDRIHFWNARSFLTDYIGVPGALIVKKIQIEDADFINQLGQFLNNHNFLGQSSGQAKVTIRSFSHSIEELKLIQDRLQKCTFNRVFLTKEYNIPPIPSAKDFKNYYHSGSADVTTFKLSETINKIQAKEPEHFAFTPPQFRGINEGQWIVELEIERHNNLESRFVNVVDTWMPPRRHKAVRAFTNNLGKVSKNHRLALMPSRGTHPLGSVQIRKEYSYSLFLPDDESFFHSLVLETVNHSTEDLRSTLTRGSYKGLSISDKGQNLRGVISMFDSLSEASECLTNKFWRQIIRHQKTNKKNASNNKNADEKIDISYELIKKEDEESGIKKCLKGLYDIGVENGKDDKRFPDNIFSWDKLFAFLPNDLKFKEQLKGKLRFNDMGNVREYLKANFTDTLEFLINKKIFYQVHQWRCLYCGHSNTLAFDHVKRTNNCEICDTKYFAPIDIEWKYKINDFVYRSMHKHTELPVLWALNYLKERTMHNSFYYLPEVDLFPDYDNSERKHEIDILCMLDGKFYAVEVKLSANGFTEKPDIIEKFIKKISLIRPDVALLAFEQYCEPEADAESAKKELKGVVADISQKIGEQIKIETVVASDFEEFNEYPVDLGYWGKRVLKMLDKINERK